MSLLKKLEVILKDDLKILRVLPYRLLPEPYYDRFPINCMMKGNIPKAEVDFYFKSVNVKIVRKLLSRSKDGNDT